MERIEIELAQGWTRGLTVAFENQASSARIDRASCSHVKQVHGAELVTLEPAHARVDGELGEADGIFAGDDILREYPKPLLVKSADCVPLIYVDREAQAVAAVHAGWRGLLAGIHRVPFERRLMNPKTTWVWMGPSLGPEHFEVGDDMRLRFGKHADDPRFFLRASDPAKRRFDAWTFVEEQLRELQTELVYRTDADTYSDPDFASYRRQGPNYGGGNLSWVGFTRPKPTVSMSI